MAQRWMFMMMIIIARFSFCEKLLKNVVQFANFREVWKWKDARARTRTRTHTHTYTHTHTHDTEWCYLVHTLP
jgi:hypothetical protein